METTWFPLEPDQPTYLPFQMLITCAMGCLQMYYPLGMALEDENPKNSVIAKPKGFWKNMFIVGSMRFLTVLLGKFRAVVGVNKKTMTYNVIIKYQ